MIKKLLIAVAAVAMPIGAATATGVVASSGVAAAASPPTATCAVTGSVAFAKPGLSAGGTLTNKTVEDTDSSTTASTTGGCSGKPSVIKIASATTACPQTGGVPNSGDPSACDASTTSKGVTTYAIAKDPYYYDTTGSYATSGLTDLETALAAKPIKTTVDGIAISLVYGSASEVYPTSLGGSGLCGSSDVGFDVQGNVAVKVGNIGTYTELACLSSDSGTGTTGSFLTDLGSSTATITSATIGGDSSLTIDIPTATCAVSGSVTFAKPGLSAGGTLTNKTVEDTDSSTTPATTGGCSGKPNVIKIASTTTACPQTGGVPNSGDPSACDASTTSKGVTTYAIAKDPYYYDTTGSYATSGLTNLETALAAKPIKTTVDGIAISLVYGSASEVYPTSLGGSGLCGSDVGFDVQGNVAVKAGNIGTYTELACLSSDSGTGTTGSFLTDLGSSTATIASATVGGDSSLTINL